MTVIQVKTSVPPPPSPRYYNGVHALQEARRVSVRCRAPPTLNHLCVCERAGGGEFSREVSEDSGRGEEEAWGGGVSELLGSLL